MAIKNTDVFIPSLLVDAIKTAFTGLAVMQGTGAVAVQTNMSEGASKVGSKVIIPYFTNMGEAEDITTDGNALTPASLTSSTTEATVKHSGKAFEMTYLAKSGASDPYGEAARQIVEACKRRIDKACVDACSDETNWSSFITDGSASTFNIDALVDTMALFGDQPDDYAALVVHSKIRRDMYKIKDTTGRPILTDSQNGAPPVLRAYGIPVITSDRVKATSNVYSNLLLKKNAIGVWIDGTPRVLTQVNALTDSEVVAAHIYWCANRYTILPGSTLPGVAIYKAKAS